MTDLEFLYVLLAAFYLWECACWVRRGGVVFVRGWGRTSRVAPTIGNQRGGLALAHPLPLFGSLAVATQLPLSLSADGLLAYVSATVNPAGRPIQTGRFLRWPEIKTIAVRGKSIHANGELLVLAQSTTHARWLAGQLRSLGKLSPEKRSEAIAELVAATFDSKAITGCWSDFENRVRSVRWLAQVLLLFVFAIAPAVIWRFGIELTWPGLVAALLALTGMMAFLFRRAHRALHPDANDERFTQCLMVLLFSPAAMRAQDLLARPLLERFHPVAVAAKLCAPAEFRRLARQILLDLQHPALPLATEGQPELAALESAFRARMLAVVESTVRDAGFDPAELTRPPPPLEATCRAYCPRCHAQFTATDLHCPDCGGLPVCAFTSVNLPARGTPGRSGRKGRAAKDAHRT